MFIELRDCGLSVETEVPFKVYYKNHIVGDYRADMIVERQVSADRIEIRHRNRLYKQKS
jgi:GxxExxY protein